MDGYLYIVAITAAKLSLLLFLYRIFHVDKRFRIAAWITGGILVLWSLITILLAIFSCRPIKASWDLKVRMDPKTVCYPKAYDVSNVYGFCNVITDVVLIVLPIPLVWKMQVNLKKKLAVAMVFATGALYVPPQVKSLNKSELILACPNSVCAVAIVRQYIAYNSSSGKDPSWGIIPIKIWSNISPCPPQTPCSLLIHHSGPRSQHRHHRRLPPRSQPPLQTHPPPRLPHPLIHPLQIQPRKRHGTRTLASKTLRPQPHGRHRSGKSGRERDGGNVFAAADVVADAEGVEGGGEEGVWDIGWGE